MMMRDFVSERAGSIPPSAIRRFFDIIQNMDDVISLGVGEPDFSTPWSICESAIYSLDQGSTSYTSNRGIPELLEELSLFLSREYGLTYSPDEEIIVTSGVSEALDLAIRSVINPGEEAIIAEPCFVAYSPCVTLAGGVPVPVECRQDDQFKLTADSLLEKITKKTKAVVINFPNNPTGAVMSRSDYKQIADVIIDNDLLLVSDEVYSALTYDGQFVSPATLDGMKERTITLNGFSKAYAMTGWRVGYLCAPPNICNAAFRIHQYVMMCASRIGQVAALAALRRGGEDMRSMVEEYRLRRNMFVRDLNKIGLACHKPLGAFYAFPSIAGTGLSDFEFTERLIVEQHVAVVPGSAFGSSGSGHLRCAYANSRENLKEAVERIECFLNGI